MSLALLVLMTGSAFAQQPPVDPRPLAGFVVVDQDRLYTESLFGQRARAEVLAESNALAEENRRIESELIAEEQALTDTRATMTPVEFRELANEFDSRVTQIRLNQDRKARALNDRQNAERAEFFQAVLPVLQQLLQDEGAQAMFDRRSVLISLSGVDITDRAIAQIDAILGDGVGSILENKPNPAQTETAD